MKALSKLLVLLATIALASCGGGGGGSKSAFTPTPADTITISPAANSITTNSFTTLTVTVKKDDGTIENNGVVVSASLSPSTIGTVSGATGSPAGTTATNTLSGGTTTFNFTSSNQAGNATISISVPAGTNGSPTAASKSVTITVTPGNTNDPRLVLSPNAVTLPLNPFIGLAEVGPAFVSNFLGSPYIAEITLTWRHSNGQLVNGTSQVNVSIDPVTIAGFSQLDDPNTPQTDPTKPDGNEFLTILGSGPINVTGGNGVIFIHSADVPGTATLTVTAIDPDNNQTISSQVQINVAGAASNLPASIFAASGGAVYVSNSGGPQSTLVNATVTDGNGALVPDPTGFDNVQFQIAGPAGTDARLTGLNAAGQSVTGTTINTVTHNGVATVSFLAGSQQGPVQIKAIADRGDNNVDNGVQDAVSATTTVVVSDGKLYSLTLATPVLDAIIANSVSGSVSASGAIPTDPNATYSFTVSATASDRQNNPVLPGTVVAFGSIDTPVANGLFSIRGTQGNPQEGGKSFSATDGHFKTTGGGSGPGDTLIVFGKETHGAPQGNADLESAAKISTVNSDSLLTVATPFNRNDTTGVIVDNGPVLPYVIGRGFIGNITSPSTTDSNGVAATKLNYPVSALGRPVAIWAQGTGTDNITGGTTLVTDARIITFPGIAPATITISPTPLPGNLTVPVVVCIQDAAQIGISGVHFNFVFQGLGIGSGSVDGISTSGVVPDPTGGDGCVTTTVITSGIDGTVTGKLTFSFGAATKDDPIVVSGNLVLLAVPSSLGGTGGSVKLTLLTSSGAPVPGVQIVGSCTGDGSIGLSSGPGVTNASGQTTAVIHADLNHVGSAGSGSCTFTTSEGAPSAVVTLQGVDACTVNVSPTPANCPNATSASVTLQIKSADANPVTASISSSPVQLTCSIGGGTTQSCTQTVPSDTYTLVPNLPTGISFVGWGGNCAALGGTNNAELIVGTTALTCTLTVKATP